MITEVAITVDVEFSIGGAFADPAARRPIGVECVHCPVGGEAAGLGFILDTLESHRLRGVFFVEVMNTHFFGDGPMGNIAREIHARGHDVQLHLHPCWTAFARADWQSFVRRATPIDSMAALDDSELDRLVGAARQVFARWGLPEACAFRAGNLQVDRRIYPALRRHGIRLASNLGVGIHRPEDRALHLNGGRHWIDDVLEVPVTSYRDIALPGSRGHWKVFTIIGTGALEAEQLLKRGARAAAGPLVVLTHPNEFVQRRHDGSSELRRNALARERLLRLCDFLIENREQFRVTTFSDALGAWLQQGSTTNPALSVSPVAAVRRFVENRRSGHGLAN
jgi:hypothetical protein